MRAYIAVICVFLLMILTPAGVSAQLLSDDDVVSVKDRPNSDTEPTGIAVGTFLLNPALLVIEMYDDNVFRTPSGEEDDLITKMSPKLDVRSNWDLHDLRFQARGDFGFYADNSNEDYEDYMFSASGRYDITYETYINALTRFEHKHEDRSAPEDVGADEPTEYDVSTLKAGFTRALGRIKLNLSGMIKDYDFENGRLNGVVVNNSRRDRTLKQGDVWLAYEFSPNYEVFAAVSRADRDYDIFTGTDRSSDSTEFQAGTAVNISGKMRGDLYGGHISRDYGTGFEDIDTESFGGSLVWNISALTSLIIEGEREVLETTGAGISGYIRTGGSATVEHAFETNLIFEASVGIDEDQFVSTGTDRSDDTIRAGLDLEYKPMRGAVLGAGYDYTNRESNRPFANYDSNRFRIFAGFTY